MSFSSPPKIEFLLESIQKLSLARSMEQIQDLVKHAARILAGSDGAAIILKDNEHCYYVDEDSIAPLWKGQRFQMSACISGWVMQNQQTAIIEDIYKDSRVPIEAYRPTFVNSLTMVPIRTIAPIGAIGNYWKNHHIPSGEEIKLLEALANSTSVAIENVQVYKELEQRVKDRTAQLDACNTELEAFTYSVSHDLRSPLTIVGGLCQMIQQDSKNSITADSQYLFSRVDSNVKRMNELIDDLLMLSKISQATLNIQEINVSEIATHIISEYKQNNPTRLIDCQIASDLIVKGDSKLIRILLENILNNAFKYTSKNENTLIVIDQLDDNHKSIYIKDNGVGFKMPEEEDQLFRPFKRFHHQEEFSGTGIGLATVKRIVRLHDGAVWVESSPNQGATFYFHL